MSDRLPEKLEEIIQYLTTKNRLDILDKCTSPQLFYLFLPCYNPEICDCRFGLATKHHAFFDKTNFEEWKTKNIQLLNALKSEFMPVEMCNEHMYKFFYLFSKKSI